MLQCRTRMLASGCVAITLVAIFASLAIPYLSGAFRIACVSPCYVLVLGASQANASPKWLRNSTCIALVPILPVLIDYICRVEAVDIDLGEDDKDTWLEEQLEDDLEEHAVNHTDLHLLEASMLADLLLICGSFVLAEASQRLARERLGSAGAQPAWISSPFGFRSVSTSSSERLSDRASDDDGAAASRSSPATVRRGGVPPLAKLQPLTGHPSQPCVTPATRWLPTAARRARWREGAARFAFSPRHDVRGRLRLPAGRLRSPLALSSPTRTPGKPSPPPR